MFLRSNFLLFSTIFSIYLYKSPVTYIFVKCGCSNYFFLNSANLICRGTDISKYFRQSLGIRDNESRLYINATYYDMCESVIACLRTCNQNVSSGSRLFGSVVGVLDFYPGKPGSNPTVGGNLFQLCLIPLLRLSCRKNPERGKNIN